MHITATTACCRNGRFVIPNQWPILRKLLALRRAFPYVHVSRYNVFLVNINIMVDFDYEMTFPSVQHYTQRGTHTANSSNFCMHGCL